MSCLNAFEVSSNELCKVSQGGECELFKCPGGVVYRLKNKNKNQKICEVLQGGGEGSV